MNIYNLEKKNKATFTDHRSKTLVLNKPEISRKFNNAAEQCMEALELSFSMSIEIVKLYCDLS